MRMRRKKFLYPRLDECGRWFMHLEIEDKNFNSASGKSGSLDFKALFGNDNPVHLELGCGKGKFSCETALINPEINLIAVEKNRNVVVEGCERAKEQNIQNLIFVDCAAEYLEYFIPQKSIERIYLNFSCPFPKNAYASHRLTHENFLKIYSRILTDEGEIFQKTDNMHFFEFSLEQFSLCNYLIKNVSLDLHNSGFEGNIVTEYEQKFIDQGLPIYRLEAQHSGTLTGISRTKFN